MSGYIGKGRSVVNVASYTKAQADAEFVNDPNSVITVSSGKLLVGTTSDYAENVQAAFYGASNGGISLASGTTGLSRLMFADGVAGTAGAYVGSIIYSHADDSLRFNVNGGTERMRLDSSGRLLVGQSSTTQPGVGNTTTGVAVRNDGLFFASAYNGRTGTFSRSGTDGPILGFYKDGSTVGSIGNSGTGCGLSSGAGWSIFIGNNGLIPRNQSFTSDLDNSKDLGASSSRWDDIYATNGTIQTSDRNEKQDIESLTEAEERVAVAAKGLLRKFKWKSAVEDKGDDARIHFGIIAQDLQDAFEAEGLDAGRYGMFISTTWTDEDGEEQTRMGVRYSELLAFIISAI